MNQAEFVAILRYREREGEKKEVCGTVEIKLKLKGQEGLPRNKEFSFANTLFGCHPM